MGDAILTTQRWALGVEYNGAPYQGWQSQPHGQTVQDVLEQALSQMAGEPIKVIAAGRTDTGVHATGQVVHFDTAAKRPSGAWVRGVNAFLPPSIAVVWAQPVSDDFHARFSAMARRYRYTLLNRPIRSPLHHQRSGWFHAPLDVSSMQQGGVYLLGEHDFSAFRAAECQAKSPIKTIEHLRLTQLDELIVLDIKANAFLHHMVRNIMGALVYVGSGRQPPNWMGDLLTHRNRSLAAPTFAPDGLCLVEVTYPEGLLSPR